VNDGSMVTGKNISVELQDGMAVFGFKSNGKAYGNRCTLEKSGNNYYYNGLRLDADPDLKYGIVDVDEKVGTSDQYVVVDSQGNLKKFRKKVLKDGDGYWIVIADGHFVARISDEDAPKWHKGQYWRYDSSQKGEDRYIEPITFASFGDDNLDDDFVVFRQ